MDFNGCAGSVSKIAGFGKMEQVGKNTANMPVYPENGYSGEPSYKEVNVFVCGIGVVGGSLLKQIGKQQKKLLEENNLKLNVVGVANTKYIMFDSCGIDIDNYREMMPVNGFKSSPAILRGLISEVNLPNMVFVDCTASARVAGLYKRLLSKGVSVVTANKIAASGEYDNYAGLKSAARGNNVKYLFETNVGAGLPIINTINGLVRSGDRIVKMEAVLSGTLNFIFNTISKDVPMSKAIRMAKEQGYSEPDPRIDLGGKDVVRKLVILAREAGYRMEQEDVDKNGFLPESCFAGSMEDFWSEVQKMDSYFEEKRAKLEQEGKGMRFAAKFENGKASVGLIEVDESHPFYALEGSNNVILITTERYNRHPMIIQGYGAGADVTAAGVFGDILSVANV